MRFLPHSRIPQKRPHRSENRKVNQSDTAKLSFSSDQNADFIRDLRCSYGVLNAS